MIRNRPQQPTIQRLQMGCHRKTVTHPGTLGLSSNCWIGSAGRPELANKSATFTRT